MRQNSHARLYGHARELFRNRAHAPAYDHPSTVRAGQATHVVHQEIMPRAGHAKTRIEPGEGIGHSIHRNEQLALKREATQVLFDGILDEINKNFSEQRANVVLRGLFYRERLFQPGRG